MSGTTPDPGADPGVVGEVAEPRVGSTIGTYRLIRLIGAGATGRVFEVEHLTIGRRAAMKILAPEHASRPGAIERLFSEAHAISQINHPHIVGVTDQVGGAILMELLEGQSLAQAIFEDKHMAPARFLPILAQVADALSAAHEARFIHRDLKPENIYLSSKHGAPDYVKLLDFGLVKTVTENPGLATAEGIFVGTPAYASPEQASGRPVDHRTDIYSLGVILYELLCGRLPFEGRNFGEFLVKHVTEEPPPTPPEVLKTAVGRTLDAVARRCLAKDPAQRYSTVAELRDLFERMAAGNDLPLVSALRARGRTPWLTAGAAALLLLAATLALRGLVQKTPPATPAPPLARTPQVVPLLPPRRVVLTFTSQPPGAETRVAGESLLLGQTPFRLTEPATGAEVVYEMRLPGHAPRRDRVVLSPDSAAVSVGGPLRRLAPAKASARSPAPKKKQSKNATLNPFAN